MAEEAMAKASHQAEQRPAPAIGTAARTDPLIGPPSTPPPARGGGALPQATGSYWYSAATTASAPPMTPSGDAAADRRRRQLTTALSAAQADNAYGVYGPQGNAEAGASPRDGVLGGRSASGSPLKRSVVRRRRCDADEASAPAGAIPALSGGASGGAGVEAMASRAVHRRVPPLLGEDDVLSRHVAPGFFGSTSPTGTTTTATTSSMADRTAATTTALGLEGFAASGRLAYRTPESPTGLSKQMRRRPSLVDSGRHLYHCRSDPVLSPLAKARPSPMMSPPLAHGASPLLPNMSPLGARGSPLMGGLSPLTPRTVPPLERRGSFAAPSLPLGWSGGEGAGAFPRRPTGLQRG